MNYQDVVDMCRNAAIAVNSSGFFVHGRREDYSLEFDNAAYRNGECGIGLLMPTPQITDSFSDGTRTYNLLFVFMLQDAQDSTLLEREQIVAAMDVLSNTYINYMIANYPIEPIACIKTPDIRNFQGTLSGVSLSLTIKTIKPC